MGCGISARGSTNTDDPRVSFPAFNAELFPNERPNIGVASMGNHGGELVLTFSVFISIETRVRRESDSANNLRMSNRLGIERLFLKSLQQFFGRGAAVERRRRGVGGGRTRTSGVGGE